MEPSRELCLGWIRWFIDWILEQDLNRREGLASTKRNGPNDPLRQPMDLRVQRRVIRGQQPVRRHQDPFHSPPNMRHPRRRRFSRRQELPHVRVLLPHIKHLRRRQLHPLRRQPPQTSRRRIFRQARPTKQGLPSGRCHQLSNFLFISIVHVWTLGDGEFLEDARIHAQDREYPVGCV